MDDEGHQPIAIGHLGDLGDLNTQQSSLYSSTCLAKFSVLIKPDLEQCIFKF